MKTFKLYAISLLCLLLWQGCEENKYKYYVTDKPTIYFALTALQQDSVVISFTKYRENPVAVHLPVEIAGYASGEERHFRVRVVNEGTTAVENTHYLPINQEQKLRANRYRDTLTVYLLRDDPELDMKSLCLRVEILANDDFDNGIWYKQAVNLVFSNKLTKPLVWETEYINYFGEYSMTKHRLTLQELSILEIPDLWDGESYKWEAYGMSMNSYFKRNEVYDENGKRILPWW
jgi:hypothetical protein